ncbi:MAG: hypothetical protein GEU90_16345 [Gemmatimonas sp.]|nr:hypothetical protein [Gemmatimonas sp.]
MVLRFPSIALILLSLGCSAVRGPSESVRIRVENATTVAFQNVVIFFPSGAPEEFGDLAPQTSSEFRVVETAYRSAAVTVQAEGETLTASPIDFVGATPLAPGRYTYILTVNPDLTRVGLEFREDE